MGDLSPLLSPLPSEAEVSRGLPPKLLSLEPEASPTASSWTVALQVAFVLIGGNLAIPPNEMLVRSTPGCVPALFLIQYLWTLSTLAPQAPTFIFRRRVPFHFHLLHGTLSFLFPHLTAVAVSIGLPASVMVVLKNLVLVLSMLAGALLLRRTYSTRHVASVVLISIGAALASWTAQMQISERSAELTSQTPHAATNPPAVLAMLAGLFCAASLGASQEYVSGKYGGAVDEQRFFQHILCIPVFLLGDHTKIVAATSQWWHSDVYWTLPLVGLQVHWFIFLLVGNTVAGDLMKRGTANLIRDTSALTATLANQVMRFVALFISACIINAPPYPRAIPFVTGALLILIGGVSYTMASQSAAKRVTKGANSPKAKQEPAKKDK